MDPIRATLPLVASVLVVSNVGLLNKYSPSGSKSKNGEVHGCTAEGTKEQIRNEALDAINHLGEAHSPSRVQAALATLIKRNSKSNGSLALIVPDTDQASVWMVRLFAALCQQKKRTGIVLFPKSSNLIGQIGELVALTLVFVKVDRKMLGAVAHRPVLARTDSAKPMFLEPDSCELPFVSAFRQIASGIPDMSNRVRF